MALLVVLLLLGLFPGYLAYRSTAHQERERTLAEFGDRVRVQVASMREHALSIVEATYSLRAFYGASREVTRAEFASFTRDMRTRHPVILAAEWAPQVAASGRAEHEAAARAKGLRGYEIRECADGGGVRPAGMRDRYFPVFYVEPLKGNESAIGLDLGAERSRREALDRARGSGEVRLSDPLVLVQEEEASYGIIAVLPVRSRGASVERLGFAVLVFRIDDLVRSSLLSGQGGAPWIHYRLADPDVSGRSITLHQSDSFPAGPNTGKAILLNDLAVAGQEWVFEAMPTDEFLAARETHHALHVGISVFLLWAAFFSSLFLLARKAIRRSLGEQSRMVRSVLGSLSEGVVVIGTEGQILLANKAAKEIVGVDPDRKTWPASHSYYLPDGKTRCPASESPLARAARGERVLDQPFVQRNKESGRELWLSVSGTPLLDDRQVLLGGVGVFRDTTLQKSSERRVQLLSSALEQAADVVFITDPEGTIEYVNPAFEQVFGYSREEAIGKTPRILKSGVQGEGYYRLLWQTLLAGRVFRGNAVNRKKNGELVHSEQTITPMRDHSGTVTHYVSVSRDMTETIRRREHEAELSVAAHVQKRLYPRDPPRMEGLDLAGAVFSADATCGDYYDYVPSEDGGLTVVIGDVSGHGLGPALLMAETRAYLRPLLGGHDAIGDTLECLHRILSPDLEEGRFVTLLAAHVDRGIGKLTFANAGHNPGYVIDAAGKLKAELGPTGAALGILDDPVYSTGLPVPLEAGDLMLFITDGVTESRAPDGSLFDDEGALELVRTHRHATAREIVDRLHGAAREFAGGKPQTDDVTIVVGKVLGRS